MPFGEEGREIIDSFPPIAEDPEPDDVPTDGLVGEGDEKEAGEEVEETAEETVAETTDTPGDTPTEEPAETPVDPRVAELEAQAKEYADFKAYLATLPPEQQQAAMEALGLAEPKPADPTPGEFYDLKELIGPAAEPLLNLETNVNTRFDAMTTELRDVFQAQSSVIDHTAVNAAIATKLIGHILDQWQLEMPKVEAKDILEGVKAGKDFDTLISEAIKPTLEKNAARMKQARAERPDTPGDEANDLEDLDIKTARMSDILMAKRGLRVG